ncbi:MAG: MarR family winged helix-turn-helix transcriptional regulator [Oscillospiraceae bacterium]
MATKEQTEFVLDHLQAAHPADFFKIVSEGNAGIGAVLCFLAGSSGDATAGKISRYMRVSTARVAVLLKKMSAKGLIVKEADAHDARVTNIRLSADGESAVQKMRGEMYAQVGAVIDKVGMDRMMEFIAISDEIRSAISAPQFAF